MATPTPKRFIRPPRVERSPKLPLWFKLFGGSAVLLVAAHFYLIHQLNQVADGLVQALGLFANASHRGGYYTWDGNLGIRRLRIAAGEAGSTSLTMAELELDTPGWWWVAQLFNPLESRAQRLSRVLGAGAERASIFPATDELHLRLRDFELSINELVPPGLPDVGFSSAAVFETEGCTNVRYFVPLNLKRDLALPYEQTDLSYGFRVLAPDQVRVELELDAGVMRTRLEADVKTDQSRHFLDNGSAGAKPLAIRWIMSDGGFIAARNRWCAEQAKIDGDEFQRRHITTVRRILEVFGVRLTPESEAVYSEFASKGGTLTVEATPPAGMSANTYAAYTGEQQWSAMNPQIWRDGSPKTAMAVEFIAARPLPKAYSGSVYDLISRHADGTATADLAFADIGAKMLNSAKNAGPADVPGPAPAPAPTPVAPRRQTPVQPTPIGLDSESLVARIGERVAVETIDGRSRVGVLLAIDPKVLTIEVAAGNGKASLSFTRERIRAVIANPVERR